MRVEHEFWNRVDSSEGPLACWPWKGSANNSGYGAVWWLGECVMAHRLSAFLTSLVSDVSAPKDRKSSGFILHECDNRRCCNPKHFKIGTYRQNQLDAYARSRREQPKGHMHCNSKLTASQASSIRNLYSTGHISQDKIAAKYGVSQRVVSLIVRGEAYK